MLRSWMHVFVALMSVAMFSVLVGCLGSESSTTMTAKRSDEETSNEDTTTEEEGAAVEPLKQAELFVTMDPKICNTPDGMALLPDGNVLLSVPNFNDLEIGSRIVKITPENEVVDFIELPNHPETDKPVGPLGVCVAPNGDLFFADFQLEGDRQSRVMRVTMEDGLPKEIVPVITGFHVSNAVIIHEGYLYVSETQIDIEATPATSGVFRFKLEDLAEGVTELSTPEEEDPRLIATIECHDPDVKFGADGLAFDKEGNLYIGNFADGTVHRLTFDDEDNVTSNEIFAKSDAMKSSDGLIYDPVDDVIYVADSRANAIQIVSLDDGKVTTLAQNGDTDGTDGGMDQPCETILRGRELIVSNMDWPVPGCINQKYNEPCVLSVIWLDGSEAPVEEEESPVAEEPDSSSLETDADEE